MRSDDEHGATDRQMLTYWSQVFDKPVSDVTADFFRLGGYSMLLMDLLTHVEQGTGVRIGLREFFAEPTPAHMAELVRRAGPVEARAGDAARSEWPADGRQDDEGDEGDEGMEALLADIEAMSDDEIALTHEHTDADGT